MKSLVICSTIIMGALYGAPLNVQAKELSEIEEPRNELEELDYATMDWEGIDEITIIYIENENDPKDIVAQAKLHNVPVKYELLPITRYTYYNSMSWITRDGMLSLSLNVKNLYAIDKEKGWTEAARYYENYPMYTAISNSTKYMSMWHQFACHADFTIPFNKTIWNIEPAKPDKGYWGFANAISVCN